MHWLSLGSGRLIAAFRVAGVRVEVNAVPFNGAVFATTQVAADFRRRATVISSAGMFVDLVAFAVPLAVLHFVGYRDPFRVPAPLEIWAAANLISYVGNIQADFDGIRTDLRHLRELARASDAEIEAMARGSAEQNQRWRDAPP